MINIIKVLVFFVVVFVVVGLALLNAEQEVSVTFLPGFSLEAVPVFLVVIASMFVGVLIAGIVSALDQVRARSEVRRQAGRIRALEAELRELRNLPIDQGLEEARVRPPAAPEVPSASSGDLGDPV